MSDDVDDARARLVIVEDNELVREGLKTMFSVEEDLEIVGEAADGQDALEVCARLRPDLTLMDVRMPRMDGLAATRTLKRRLPGMSVLVLTAYENADYLLDAVRAGASGYVLKDAPREQLMTAVRKVLEGEATLSRDLTTRLLRQLAGEMPENRQAQTGRDGSHEKAISRLTARETEVLGLLARGYTNPKISETLYISLGTAKNHVEHIFDKLEVSDRTQAVVRAFELGIITPAEI